MAALSEDLFPPRLHPATGRFTLAIAASAGAHLWLTALIAIEAPQRGAAFPAAAAITVHLEPKAEAVPAQPVVPASGPPFTAGQDRRHGVAAAAREPRRREKGARLALPPAPAPDPGYYSVRDLDVYPRPLAPLELGALASGAAARFRFALMIDESGIVNDVAAVETGPGGRAQEALRAALAATRFTPGQKDGRAVKSRVLLDISLGPEQREP